MPIFLAMLIFATFPVFSAEDLKTEEIIAKHIESLGTKERRADLSTLMAVGTSQFEARIPAVKGGGKAIVVSNPENLFFVISLNSKEYPYEKVGYFSGKMSLPFISAGTRSLLGLFLNEHEKLLSDGLFGGAMSMRWALLNTGKTSAKINSSGTKKIDGRKAYVLDYIPTGVGSSDFTVRLFIDAENFNHLRSEYRREVVRGQGTFGQANQQANAVITLAEDFSDYKMVDGLNLPHNYRVKFSSNSNSSSNENIWGISVAQYYFNQKLAADFFTFDPKS